MLDHHHRAFKEWAVVCEALKCGRQIVLIRKGGIREEEGIFQVNDPEFFLLPTYEHQNAKLVQPQYVNDLRESISSGFDPKTVTIDTYATVDTVVVATDEERVSSLASEHIWNDEYVRMRFDFNPYDPLYILILRAYRLQEAVTLPMLPEYVGCKSWVTLEKSLSTIGVVPAVPGEEFIRRRDAVLEKLGDGYRVSGAEKPTKDQ
jgi:hypothetical protein